MEEKEFKSSASPKDEAQERDDTNRSKECDAKEKECHIKENESDANKTKCDTTSKDDGTAEERENDKIKILILCSCNNNKSHIASEFLNNLDSNITVYTVGDNNNIYKTCKEAKEEMSKENTETKESKSISSDNPISKQWDYVITMCDCDKEWTPIFLEKVKYRLHFEVDDSSILSGAGAFVQEEFNKVKDQVTDKMTKFYDEHIKPKSCNKEESVNKYKSCKRESNKTK